MTGKLVDVMQANDVTAARCARMRWNTPLSEEHAGRLLERLDVGRHLRSSTSVVVGASCCCASSKPAGGTPAVSEWIRTGPPSIAVVAGLTSSVSATGCRSSRRRQQPGRRLLFGDGCWEKPPTAEATEMFGDEVLPLEALVDHALDAGWRVLPLSTTDQREWDDFESTWRAVARNGFSLTPTTTPLERCAPHST